MFIINCKNYDEVAGEKIIKIAKLSERISKKYKIGQHIDRKSRIDLAKQIMRRNSSTAKETLDIMGFEIIDNEPKLVDDTPW